MKTVQLIGKREVSIIDKPLPQIKENYVLVKIHVAPMCNEYHAYKDWFFRYQERPDALGHEAAGEVIETGSSRFQPGDRVVVLDRYPCGKCRLCRLGYYAHCQDVVDPLVVCDSPSGDCGFAQYVIKPDWLLIPIPDSMSYEHASMACCGLGGTFTAFEKMQVNAYDTVLVTGLGPVGLGAIINAVARRARVIGVARNAYRSALAKKLGAIEVVDPRNPRVIEIIKELTNGEGVDCAIDCSAVPMYQRLALDATRAMGRVSFVGESGELNIHIDNDIIQKGLTIYGNVDLYLQHVPAMMQTIEQIGPLIDTFVTHKFPLGNIAKAWELQISGQCGKILLYPWAEA